MPIIEKHWGELTDEKWQHLIKSFLMEIRKNSGKDYEEGNHKWSEIVTNLSFWASPEVQWKFIIDAVSLAETDKELGHIAAGNIERLLGKYGEDYIDLVETEAKNNQKFARTLTGCLQYMMTDEIWARVQKLQAQVKNRLDFDKKE